MVSIECMGVDAGLNISFRIFIERLVGNKLFDEAISCNLAMKVKFGIFEYNERRWILLMICLTKQIALWINCPERISSHLMKNVLLFVFLLCTKMGLGQVDLVNHTLKNAREGTLYIGVGNIISIAGVEKLSDSTRLISGKFKVIRLSNNKGFNVLASDLATDTLKLFNGDELIAEKVYKSEMICNPIVTYGDFNDGTITKSQLWATRTLNCSFSCNFNTFITVTNFTLSVRRNGWAETDFVGKVDGNTIPDDYFNTLLFLKSGDEIIFSGIVVLGHHFCPRTFEDLHFFIE